MALEWLKDSNQELCKPYIVEEGGENEDDESLYPPANSLEELREMYESMDPERRQKKEVLDRIAEGDWVRLSNPRMLDMNV